MKKFNNYPHICNNFNNKTKIINHKMINKKLK